MFAKERLYLTADKKKLVGEGDKRAAILYAAIGDEIPEAAAKSFDLVEGKLPSKGKSSVPPVNPGSGSGDGGDDLTELKGIGKKTADALNEAGIKSFAALAAIDPKKPGLLVPGVGESDWIAWTAAAKDMSSGDA